MNKYISSGRFSLMFLFYLFISIITIFPLLWLIYSYLIFYIPIIFLNFVVCIWAWLLLWIVSGYIVKLWKVRNSILGILIWVIWTFSFFYFSWIVWVDLVINISWFEWLQDFWVFVSLTKTLEIIGLVLNPLAFFDLILQINSLWTWWIKDIQFNGWILFIVWFFEAIIIFHLSIFNAFDVSKKPFSEKNNSWYKSNIYNFTFIDTNIILDAFKNDNFSFIWDISKISVLDKDHLEFILYYSDNDDYILSINKKILKTDKNWKLSFNFEEIIKYSYIDFWFAKKIESLK